ncbi:MAG: hypothetical protein H7A51_06620 [Akkermansiaceae bacterium]|nr:hypothetical protein [Akkermansiaceae bacterium]
MEPPPQGLQSRQLQGRIRDGKLTFVTNLITFEGHPVLVFDGRLSRQELRHQAEEAYRKLQAIWYRMADRICLEVLPEYENVWLRKCRPVTGLYENPLGVRGLVGGAKEWVEDRYNGGDDNRRTLRGGAMRLRGRGPLVDEIKAATGHAVDYVMQYAISPQTELLSSYRQPGEPEGRCSWYGFRVVLEIEK